MSEWIERLARELGVAPLSPEEERLLLPAARDVAHRVERKDTPLAAYLVGLAVGGRTASGVTRSEAFADALDDMIALLPDGTHTRDG